MLIRKVVVKKHYTGYLVTDKEKNILGFGLVILL